MSSRRRYDLFLFARTPSVLVSPAAADGVLILVRWVHLVAGIIWIGLLYFFVLVNADFLGELTRSPGDGIPKLMPRAMWWFRWSSFLTVSPALDIGITSSRPMPEVPSPVGETASAGAVIGSFLVIWTVAFAIEMGR